MLRTDKERIVAELADQLSAADTLIVADGTSCRHQIHDGAQRAALHVARVLAMSLAARERSGAERNSA